jgi:four helix bundle protein
MSRDPWRLKVMVLADELAMEVYRATKHFPVEERFGLQAQLRRAAVSTPSNIVEGCARRTQSDYLRFVNMSLSSASETRYLLGLSQRLHYLDAPQLADRYGELIRGLQALEDALENRPEA